MKKVSCSTMGGVQSSKIATWKSIFMMALIFVLSTSPAFALTVPTSGPGFVFYTIINGLFTTGLGYVIAAVMFLWGCISLPKDWKHALEWMAGGLGVASLSAMLTAAGLSL